MHACEDLQEWGELRGLLRQYGVTENGDSVAVCYGSSVREDVPDSDLDMLIIEGSYGRDAKHQNFIDAFIALHKKTGRKIDEEVPYANKLFYAPAEVERSLSLSMFSAGNGALQIQTLEKIKEEDPYFSSRAMKLRLLFNAFTSSNTVVAGNEKIYATARERATHSLGYMARKLITQDDRDSTDITTAIQVLSGKGNAHYKDYLGYVPEDSTFVSSLEQGLTRPQDAARIFL